MKKILLALLVAPTAAYAQVPAPTSDAPRTLDPGGGGAGPAPAAGPSRPAPAAQPNVIVVGPDGKVSYDPNQAQQPSGYYISGDQGHFNEPDQPVPVHSGPTPDLHVVRRGDTLWDICFYYFNDPWQWPKVWSYNPSVTNPHWIYPGDLVRLLPRGAFDTPADTTATTATPDTTQPADNLPAPAQRTSPRVKQTAFVEKADIDKSIQVDGSVDEKALLAPGDSVYLSYPANNPPKVGARYSIYKPDNTVKHEGKEVGAYVRILGTVEVVSVKQDKRARGVIVEANQEIERGAKVGPLVKQFKNVTPVPAKVDLQANIVAILTREQLIGQGEVVFIDAGKGSGVVPGNRMFVVRRGDALPQRTETTVGQDDQRFPARALGEITVIEVGDNISIGLVTLAVQEMGIGDHVFMQKDD